MREIDFSPSTPTHRQTDTQGEGYCYLYIYVYTRRMDEESVCAIVGGKLNEGGRVYAARAITMRACL